MFIKIIAKVLNGVHQTKNYFKKQTEDFVIQLWKNVTSSQSPDSDRAVPSTELLATLMLSLYEGCIHLVFI